MIQCGSYFIFSKIYPCHILAQNYSNAISKCHLMHYEKWNHWSNVISNKHWCRAIKLSFLSTDSSHKYNRWCKVQVGHTCILKLHYLICPSPNLSLNRMMYKYNCNMLNTARVYLESQQQLFYIQVFQNVWFYINNL